MDARYCFGFPLHQAGKPWIVEARDFDVERTPMLLLQGPADIGLLDGAASWMRHIAPAS